MNSMEKVFGSLLFFRKDGQLGTTYPLYSGKITIGSSRDADIRLKINDKRLEEIHCIIEVNDDGTATLLNKSVSDPVKINTVSIRKSRILVDDDEIELVGKKFLYLNGTISKKNTDNHQKCLKDARSTPSKKRHSVTPLINLKSANKTTNFKTKIPIQRKPSTRKFVASTSSEFVVMQETEPEKGNITDIPKTTSKIIVSKALGSPGSSKKRRLSFGDKLQKLSRSPKLSTRNILLSENIISSTMTEDNKSFSPKRAPLDNNDLSSDGSIKLNLSSNSSVSPLSSPRRSSTLSSKKSLSRKSLRKSQLQEGSVSNASNNSLLKQCLKKNQNKSSTRSRESLRKSKTIEQREEQLEDQFTSEESEEESQSQNKSITKPRQSLRESKMVEKEEDQPEKQSSSEELLLVSESVLPNIFSRKSRLSLRKSKMVESREQFGDQFSNEESRRSGKSFTQSKRSLRRSNTEEQVREDEELLMSESQTPNKPLRKSRLSLRKSKTVEKSANESVTRSASRMSWTIENGEEKQTEKLLNEESPNTSGIQSLHVTKSRLSLSKSKAVKREGKQSEEQSSSEESSMLEIYESRSTRKSVRSRQSLMRNNMRKEKQEEESSGDFENTYVTATPKQRKSLKRNFVTDKVEHQEDPSKSELMVNITNLNTPNGEAYKGKHASVRNSLRASREHARESLLNISIRAGKEDTVWNIPKKKSLQRLSTAKKSIGMNKSQSSNQDSSICYMSSSKNSTPVSPTRRNNVNETLDQSIYSSDDEFEVSAESQHVRNTPKLRHSSVRKSHLNNEEEGSEIETSFNNSTKSRSSSTRRSNLSTTASKSDKTTLTTSRASREHAGESLLNTSIRAGKEDTPKRFSQRKSNKSNRTGEILVVPTSEEPLVLGVSAMSTPKEISIQKRLTITKERESSVRKSNRLNNEKIGELSSSEVSSDQNVSSMITPKETSIQNQFPVTHTERRKSSVRKSNRFSRDEKIDALLASEESVNISTLNTSKETSIQRWLTATPKEAASSSVRAHTISKEAITSMETPKERVSSVRKSNRLNGDKGEQLYSSEESLASNVSTVNTPEEISEQRKRSITTELMSMITTPKNGEPSVKKSDKLNKKPIGEFSSSEESLVLNVSAVNTPKEKLVQRSSTTPKETLSTVRTPSQRGSAMRKSNKLNAEVGEMSSSEESLILNISAMNTPKETSAQRRSTKTPKQSVSLLRTSKERRSSLRKSNKLNTEDDIVELLSSKESVMLNVSAMKTPKETSVQRRSTTTPKESVSSLRTSKERRSSLRKSNKLNTEHEIGELSYSEESLILDVSTMNTPKEASVPKESVSSPRSSKERRSLLRKSNKLNTEDEIGELSSSEESLHLNVSATNTPKEASVQRLSTSEESVSSLGTLKERRSTMRNILKRKEDIGKLSSSEESFVLNISSNTAEETSADEEIGELFSSDDSLVLNVSVWDSPKEKSLQRLSTPKKSIGMNKSQSSNQDSSICYMSSSKNSTPVSPTRRNNVNETLDQSIYSSDDEFELSVESQHVRNTPKLRHSSVRKSHLNNEEEGSEIETSTRSRSSSTRRSNLTTTVSKSDKTTLTTSKKNISVITLNDTIDSTPENSTSIIIIDAPSDETHKFSHKKLSKTLNSSLKDDVELTTPKSAIKSRRSKSLPYNPLTEEITPVTPLSKSKNESGFKTPLNTPGLFEDIKKSVLRSRGQIQKSSTSFVEELNKIEPTKKTAKRPRESSGGAVRSSKKRKMLEIQADQTFDTDGEVDDTSFDSFTTEDVLTDISEQNFTQVTPKHFSDLTDKPVITHPQTRSLTEPKKRKPTSPRRSLHSMRLESQLGSADDSGRSDIIISQTDSSSEQNDSVFEGSTDLSSRRSSRRSSRASLKSQKTQEKDSPMRLQISQKNDLSDVAGLKKLLKAPKNDPTDVKGVKTRLQTPKTMNSPKNDLINVPNLTPLMSPRAINNCPKNDLTNIIEVNKLLATPKPMKSPKNDLRQIPNLRKLISPKRQNSPKNDLSDVAGIKKLLDTPKDVKSPKNDLRNIPNLRRLMSPKVETSPKNDLTDVGGVKKLFSSPKTQKSPRNDLTNVPNLRRIMSPKHQNSPKNDLNDVHGLKKLMRTPRENKEPYNDLRDVEGVANIFNMSGVQRLSMESDIENNEDLFDKLFAKKPLKTYRGKSLSPASRKSLIFDDKRKTLGDVSYTSPRVEKWIKEQAIIKLKRIEDTNAPSTPAVDKISEVVKKDENEPEGSHKRVVRGRRMGKKNIEETPMPEELTVGTEKKETHKRTIGGSRNIKEALAEAQITAVNEIKEKIVANDVKVNTSSVSEDEVRNKRKINQTDQGAEIKFAKRTRGRRKADDEQSEEQKNKHEVQQTSSEVDEEQSNEISNTNENVDEVNSTSVEPKFKHPPVKRGRPKKISREDETDQIPEVHSTTEDVKSPAPKRGRGRKVTEENEDTETTVAPPRRGGRTRKVVQDEEELLQPKRVRGRRKSPVKNDDEGATESDVMPVMNEKTHSKRARVRKIVITDEVIIVENDTESKSEEDQTAEKIRPTSVITKRIRGRKQNTVESDTSKISTRSKRIASDSTLDSIEETVKSVHQNDTEEEVSKVKEDGRTGNQRVGRLRKKVVEKENENEDYKKEAESVKTSRGKRQRTTKKVAHEDSEDGENEIAEVVKKTGKTKKTMKKANNVNEKEPASSKSVRGRKRLVEKTVEESDEGENKSPEVVKKTGRSKKKVAEEEMQKVEDEKKQITVKPTRGRKQPKIADTSENEEVQVVTIKTTRGKVVSVDPIPMDSPRTMRLKRGNFNKYGSEFLTEITDGKEGSNEKKRVRFEGEEPQETGDGMKRRGRNAIKTDKVEEETLRKSKRVRK